MPAIKVGINHIHCRVSKPGAGDEQTPFRDRAKLYMSYKVRRAIHKAKWTPLWRKTISGKTGN